MDAHEIMIALENRSRITDDRFDLLFPATQRHRSEVHWTPVEVALHVAAMLGAAPGGKVLDVGAGVGKACFIGALTTPARWTGVERNQTMVRVAKRIAVVLGLQHTTSFIHADAVDIDWTPFGGVYLYNPFAEALFDSLDEPVLSRAAYIAEVLRIERKLATLERGARVVTFHGFGGDMPRGFVLVEAVPMCGDALCHWTRKW